MKQVFALLFAFLFTAPLLATPLITEPSEGAKVLFKGVPCKLTDAEKEAIYKKMGFTLSKDKTQFVLADDKDKEYPFTAQVLPTDMNADGKEEIFVVYGNSFTSGNAGTSVVLFIKNAVGVYSMHLGFPGTVPDAMATKSGGYPDLLISGPGMEFPVWRWNGKAYAHYRQVKDSEYGKLKLKNIEDVSKEYVGKK